ncbi:MAG: PD-(D/E)XK nuclease family protein [Anaerolineae bacterium]|nr:PD-(D/E)XK nuclease family protein [Anaerolineae bacterium]
MALPDTFRFSQGNLQDYVDCQRRFQLRYVLMQPWPALITEPALEAERHMQRGADLHHLAHQHALELDAGRLEATIHDEVLARWWRTYLAHPPPDLPETVRRAEMVLAAPLAGYRLVAKYDLLAVEPGARLVVVDWKAVLNRPSRATLASRLQTRVYRYLAVKAGAAFNGGHVPHPEQVEMIYWFAEFGGAIERFPYSADQYAADEGYLAGLVIEIAAHSEPIWPLTPDERRCRFCNYRSLCERGAVAAFLDDLEDDLEPSEVTIDLEQIAEVAF